MGAAPSTVGTSGPASQGGMVRTFPGGAPSPLWALPRDLCLPVAQSRSMLQICAPQEPGEMEAPGK